MSEMKDHTEDALWQGAMANLRWAMGEGYENQKADAIDDLISVRLAMMMEDLAGMIRLSRTQNQKDEE